MLSEKGEIIAGPLSLMDYARQDDTLELMNWCIANHRDVKSVMLFSKKPWSELEGGTVGITDDTATSVQLLRVLLAKKYNVNVTMKRMHAGVNDWSEFDAVLLIGDEALRRRKTGIESFTNVYDLAVEWQQWQGLPFVFAVWARRKDLPQEEKNRLDQLLADSLAQSEKDFAKVGAPHGTRIGLSSAEVADYLGGFSYRIGEAELKAIERFRQYAEELEGNDVVPALKHHHGH
jgi:chorismate dehydratase